MRFARTVLTMVALSAVMISSSATVGAQQTRQKSQTTKATSSRARGADPNITKPRNRNSVTNEAPAPANKAGGKARGATIARVLIDNSTPWYIDIYVDGSYRGTIEPWGDAYANALPGETHLYARADFTDGSVKTWGPNIAFIDNGELYSWRLVR
jgi:hypothetical protein